MPIHTLARRPDLTPSLEHPHLNPGPQVMFHDHDSTRLWPHLPTTFGEHQLALVESDHVIARAHSVPIAWHHSEHDLPQGGYAWALRQAFDDHTHQRTPTIAVALYIAIAPTHQGKGLSSHMARALRANAASHGLTALAAPLRPTLKHHYPLIPMARYATWKRPDGTHFDPWIRTHHRLGAHILHPCEESMHVTGTLHQWRQWAGKDLPGSGDHIVDGALSPVTIDVEADHGHYTEPNLWAWHHLEPTP